MFSNYRAVAAIGCCLLGVVPFVAVAADQADEAMAERCISLNGISSTDVVDDYNILFYMHGGKIYRNELRQRCIGLKNERAFMYRTSLSQLCDVDIVTVLYDHGFGFTPGASCSLGRFYPITKEDAKALKEALPPEAEKKEAAGARPEEMKKPQ